MDMDDGSCTPFLRTRILSQALKKAIENSNGPQVTEVLEAAVVSGKFHDLTTWRFDGDLTPAQFAFVKVYRDLVEARRSPSPVFSDPVENVALMLLHNGFPLPRDDIVVGRRAYNPLTIATFAGLTRLMRYMIVDMGWGPDMGLSRDTPLVTVCSGPRSARCTEHVLKILLDEGADPNAVDSRNWTVLEYLVQGPFRLSRKFARLLIMYGANVDRVDARVRMMPSFQSYLFCAAKSIEAEATRRGSLSNHVVCPLFNNRHLTCTRQRPQGAATGLLDLPHELIVKVLSYMRPVDLGRVSGVCTWLHAYCHRQEVWTAVLCEVYRTAAPRLRHRKLTAQPREENY